MSLSSYTADFKSFLDRSSWESISVIQPNKSPIGFVVSAWFSTPLAYWVISVALNFRKKGHAITIIFDDIAFENSALEIRDNAELDKFLLSAPSGLWNLEKLSEQSSSLQKISDLDALQINNLATYTTIRTRLTSIGLEHENELRDKYLNNLRSTYPQILSLFEDKHFDWILVPHGVWGHSGLFYCAGRLNGVRVASFDSGDGRLLQGISNVACYFEQLPETLNFLLDSNYDLKPLLEMAKYEQERRKEGNDSIKYQVCTSEEQNSISEFDILIPLSIDWDAPNLGKNRFFSSPAKWLESTVKFILLSTKHKVIVRQHPAAAKFSFVSEDDGYYKLLRGWIDKYPDRIRFIHASEKVNSYSLLEKSPLVLPYISTFGIEAAAYGCKVVLESNTHYSECSFVYKAPTLPAYEKAIASLGNDITHPSRTEALLYFLLFQHFSITEHNFTPIPNDFKIWSQLSMDEVFSDPNIVRFFYALEKNIPHCLLVAESVLKNAKNSEDRIKNSYPSSEDDDGVIFGNPVQIIGKNETMIESGSVIGDDTWINVTIRDGKKRVSIGHCSLIGRRAMISAEEPISIGAYNIWGPDVLLTNVEHCVENPSIPVVLQGNNSKGNLTVEENCWFGHGAKIIGGITIGRGSIVAAGSIVINDVPPFCVVVGAPAKIVKVFDFTSETWMAVGESFGVEYLLKHRTMPNREVYLSMLEKHKVNIPPIVAGNGQSQS